MEEDMNTTHGTRSPRRRYHPFLRELSRRPSSIHITLRGGEGGHNLLRYWQSTLQTLLWRRKISEALCQGVKGGKRVAPTELEDTKACRRGLLLLESTRLQYAMKVSLVGVISCSPAPFCCCGGRQSDVREHLQTSFNRGVRALSLARTPMLQLDDTGEGPHAPEHHSLSI